MTIPNSVTYIGGDAFSGCTSLESVSIPNSVKSIYESAFSGCTNLSNVTIGNSVTQIYNFAFSGCTSLSNVTIGNSVTQIYHYAFSDCTSLSKVSYNGTLADWCAIDFLENDFANPLSNKNAILYIEDLPVTDAQIPNDATKIKNYAFYGYRHLTNVTIPDSVTTIGIAAFYYCKNLKSVTIPKSVKSFEILPGGENTFYECTALENVYYDGTQAEWNNIKNINDIFPDDVIIHSTDNTWQYKEGS